MCLGREWRTAQRLGSLQPQVELCFPRESSIHTQIYFLFMSYQDLHTSCLTQFAVQFKGELERGRATQTQESEFPGRLGKAEARSQELHPDLSMLRHAGLAPATPRRHWRRRRPQASLSFHTHTPAQVPPHTPPSPHVAISESRLLTQEALASASPD